MSFQKITWIAVFCSLNLLNAQYEGANAAENSDTTKAAVRKTQTSGPVPTVHVNVAQTSNTQTTSIKNGLVRPTAKQTFLGFNTSFLLGQILPFNAIPLQQNMYAVMYRSYRKNSGYRFNVGFDVDGGDGFHWFGGRLDYDTRRSLNSKWNYFYGGGAGLEIFDDPTATNFFSSTEVNLLGQLHWGFEYHCGELVSLSMETQAMLLLGTNSALRLRPPTVITAHFKL